MTYIQLDGPCSYLSEPFQASKTVHLQQKYASQLVDGLLRIDVCLLIIIYGLF